MNKVVLDASAVLAVFFLEEGKQAVEPVLFGASMSAVNYSEVLKKAVEKRGSLQQARYFLDRQSISIVPFDASQAVPAASILPQTSPFGLSFADSTIRAWHLVPFLERKGLFGAWRLAHQTCCEARAQDPASRGFRQRQTES